MGGGALAGPANLLDKASRGGGGIGRGADGRDDGDGIGTGADDLRYIVHGDPSDSDEGHGDVRAYAPEKLGADEPEARLRPGGEHAAHGDIVRSVVPRVAGLVLVVGGHAEEHARAQQPSRLARGQVVLPHVDAVGLDGQRQIHAVIDDEEAAGLAAPASQVPRDRVELNGRQALLAELDEAAAAGEDGVQERRQLPSSRRSPVEDDVKGTGEPCLYE
jgi:hypothetical protein